MNDTSKPTRNTHSIKDILDQLDQVKSDTSATQNEVFNREEHDSKSRLEITKLFLTSYFWLIAGSFVFCLIYNYGAACLNFKFKLETPVRFIDVSNTVSIITTTLSSGMGFVIGYYFKNKE